jgi:hypothetical protein
MSYLQLFFLRRRRAWITLAILAGLLWLDLNNRGLMWQFFWSQTGEEKPFSQLRGMIEYLGNLTRLQPVTQPDVPINHVDVSPFGINTFLQQEVELAKRERQMQMIAEAGFAMIRQQFPWEDIEIHGRGDFIDRRNESVTGVINAWDKYDNILALAEQYGLDIQARLDDPPQWTHQNPDIGDKAPPDDLQDYVNYAVSVATRYKGRIRYYQVWNEPNIYPEWGNQPVSPEGYTELLCRTYRALKQVDPDIVVISGPLAPTLSLSERDLNDFIFLQRMYQAGAKDCFDVLSAQGYGFSSGPSDRRMRFTHINFARNLYIRDIMVANGDAHKAIWISEAGWNSQPDDPAIIQNGAFGIVTEDEAARYMPLGYQRALEEWPWIGNVSYWFFKRANDSERNQAFYYFRMVEPDFIPLPVYDSMKDYITNLTPTLYAGVHQAEDWAVKHSEDAKLVEVEGAEFGTAVESSSAELNVYGTHVTLRLQTPNWTQLDIQNTCWILPLSMTDPLDDHVIPQKNFHIDDIINGWLEINLPIGISAQLASIKLGNLKSCGSNVQTEPGPFILDSITVADRTYLNLLPYAATIAILIGMTLLAVADGLRRR